MLLASRPGALMPKRDDDASQFSRQYKRLFGRPPMRDVEWLREAARR